MNMRAKLVGVIAGVASVVPLAARQAPPAATPAPAQTPAPAAPGAPAPAAPASAPAPANSNSTIFERVLVRVNGEIFTQSQLTTRQIAALRDMDKDKRDEKNLPATLADITPNLLVIAVDELLLVQRAREMGVKFTDDQFKDAVENIKKDNKLDDAGFTQALKQEGMSMDELRQQLEKTFFIRAVQQREIGPSMSVTQEEERQYYEKHKDQFMTPLTVTLREILVSVTTTSQRGQSMFSVSDDATSRAKIDALRSRAVAGEDFVKLVTEGSDSTSKSAGGLIGPVAFEDLTPALQDQLKALQPGGITLPIRGPRGYQIYRLEARSTPELRPFDSVKNEVERDIRDERLDPETEKMLSRLRSQAVIEWKDDGFKRMYEKALAARQQASQPGAPAPASPLAPAKPVAAK